MLNTRTSRELFRTCQNHYNQILNKVLTRYRLCFPVRYATQTQTLLSFFNGEGEASAVPLPPTPWYLFIGKQLRAESVGNRYSLRILEYRYRIQRTPLLEDEAEVRFEYVSPEIDLEFPYSRHHVQSHRAFQEVREGFAPNKLHLPTGGVTIEQVIRFLIADLGVPPLTERWQEELRESESTTSEWFS